MLTDDRMEIPQGYTPVMDNPSHPIMLGIQEPWPTLLGYNKVILKSNQYPYYHTMEILSLQSGNMEMEEPVYLLRIVPPIGEAQILKLVRL